MNACASIGASLCGIEWNVVATRLAVLHCWRNGSPGWSPCSSLA